ncbi:MAG: hypothetical protein H7Y03_03265 [Chitinophagaceae bacterium]|nr:hypothetical protein [Chitinophagaceae bacterium]
MEIDLTFIYEITLASLSLLQEYNPVYGLAIPDSLIAAKALETRVPLFTYNLKESASGTEKILSACSRFG